MKNYRFLSTILFSLVAQPASAAIIDYELISLGGSSYRYEYAVTNDGSLGAGVSVEIFDILFDTSLYDDLSLNIVTLDPPASDWDEYFLGSGIGIPSAYEAWTWSTGIADGDTVFGFAVEFGWLGEGIPGEQGFEVYDPLTFNLLETGTTRSSVEAVPEPNTLALFLLAAIGAYGVSLMQRKSQ